MFKVLTTPRQKPEKKMQDTSEYSLRRRRAMKDGTWSPNKTDASVDEKDLPLHRRLVSEYGITLAEYRAISQKQDNQCLICTEEPPDGQRLCVDHCHETGIIRGLLCQNCNRALGLFKDDPVRLKSAVEYLSSDTGLVSRRIKPRERRRNVSPPQVDPATIIALFDAADEITLDCPSRTV